MTKIFSRFLPSFFVSIALAVLFAIQCNAQRPLGSFTARENDRQRTGIGHFAHSEKDSIDRKSVV